MLAAIESLPVVEFTDARTLRMISTAFIDEPAMAPLVDDPEDLALLARIEAKTSRRQDGDMPLPEGLRRTEMVTEAHGFGWTWINAAFCYVRPTGSRFNGPERGAWYAAWGLDAVDTALDEVCFHLTREFDNVGVYDNITDCREVLAGFTTPMVDLGGAASAPYLDPDSLVAYPSGQDLARQIRGAGRNGVLYPSARRNGGRCLAAFRPTHVQNVRPGDRWRLTWSGGRTPVRIRV